jgi:hypothetical protein
MSDSLVRCEEVEAIWSPALFDDLNGYFYENLVPAYDAFCESYRRNDSGRNIRLRTAVDAATALFHFREHIPTPHTKSRGAVTAECTDYALIADVANASKHKKLDRPTPTGPALVTLASDIYEQINITQYEDVEGPYTDCRVAVLADCSDGICRNVDSAVINVFDYWRLTLHAMNVNEYPRCAFFPTAVISELISRADARAPSFEIVNAVRWSTRMQLLKYSSADGRSHPVDLTGAKIEMNICRPAYTLHAKLKNKHGAELSAEIALTDEQAQEYHSLKDDASRQSFIEKVASLRKDEILTSLRAGSP